MEYMEYVEMTVEEANKLCKKNAIVLVVTTSLEDNSTDASFIRRRGTECEELFKDAQTILKYFDDFVKQLNVFTVKQDKYNILPRGNRSTILLH